VPSFPWTLHLILEIQSTVCETPVMLRSARSLLIRSHIGLAALACLLVIAIAFGLPMLDPFIQRLGYGILDRAFRPPLPHHAADPVDPPIMSFYFVRCLGVLMISWVFARWLYGPRPILRTLSSTGDK
jgi:hypothetical protein